jgi:hypothetical protein
VLGAVHPRTLDARNNLAVSLIERDTHRGPSAEAMFAELVDTRRETNGRSVDTAAALENLASVTEEPSERVELLEEAYRIQTS